MSISISQINLDSEVHREIVMKLCNRNNFYKDDVYVELYRNFPPERKNKMIELLGVSHFNNTFNKFIEENFAGLKSIGYFITIEKDNKKKVAGFIIYNLEEIANKSYLKSYLLFILIDKLIVRLNSNNLTDSPSQSAFLFENNTALTDESNWSTKAIYF